MPENIATRCDYARNFPYDHLKKGLLFAAETIIPEPPQETADYLTKLCSVADNPSSMVLQIFDNQGLFGHGIATPYTTNPAVLILDGVAVSERRQGQKFGRLIVMRLVNEMVNEGTKQIRLEALRSKVGFYSRLGFVVDPQPSSKTAMFCKPEDLLRQVPAD